jgi:hypothetical protein
MSKYLTRQQIFDRVKLHLLTQKVKSVAHAMCLYHGPDNTSCAVGCLIPDKHYQQQIEGRAVSRLQAKYQNDSDHLLYEILKCSGIRVGNRPTLNLLNDLQYIHDYTEVGNWSKGLAKIARQYKLTNTNIKKLRKNVKIDK